MRSDVQLFAEHIAYDPATGDFKWKVRRVGRGELAGTPNRRKDTSYRVICIDGRKYYAHRIAWLMIHGDIPKDAVIDHIDGDGLNNRLENLRAVPKSLNQRNRRTVRGGQIAGLTRHRGGYSIAVAGAYAGWTKDFFEACCIRKSGEAKTGYVQNGSKP